MVGLNCRDIVNFVPSYPLEDSDQRSAIERRLHKLNNIELDDFCADVLPKAGSVVEMPPTMLQCWLNSESQLNTLGLWPTTCF